MKIKKGKFFPKGVHVPDNKSWSKDVPIEVMEAPDIVCIGLQQHIGRPSVPVVGPGDEVLCGQLIAKEGGYIGANVYSSVSGKVTGIEKRPGVNGVPAEYIVIENDHHDRTMTLPPLPDREPATIKARIREAGIVGMGGAGFPTEVKLSPKTPVDSLVINAAECEPYLTCDYRLMVEKTDEVAQGIRLLAKALGVEKIFVGIEKNKPDAIELFSRYDDMQVVSLKKAYPMGSEKHLIYSCTGRKVPCGKLPADAGCVVQNVATAFAVYEAVEKDKPLYERVMTVSGCGAVHHKNLLVRTGTPFSALRENCGVKDDVTMFVSGGPMMGPAMASTDVYSTKTTSGFLMMLPEEIDVSFPTPCINCGACADACPMNLAPMQIDFYTQSGQYDLAAKYGGVKDCISCGTCAYVCPAKRALTQSIALCKQKLAQAGGKK
ncbi:MAG: electron transport complex subunit RsxC [Clostridia bacterium]|nr:electron transport complex subunit RsxC [Clostridia bacterium]